MGPGVLVRSKIGFFYSPPQKLDGHQAFNARFFRVNLPLFDGYRKLPIFESHPHIPTSTSSTIHRDATPGAAIQQRMPCDVAVRRSFRAELCRTPFFEEKFAMLYIYICIYGYITTVDTYGSIQRLLLYMLFVI